MVRVGPAGRLWIRNGDSGCGFGVGIPTPGLACSHHRPAADLSGTMSVTHTLEVLAMPYGSTMVIPPRRVTS